MPTNRVRRLRARRATLDAHKRLSLLLGPENVILAGGAYYACGASNIHTLPPSVIEAAEREMLSDWLMFGPALLEWWTSGAPELVEADPHPWTHVERGGPCSRPWAWWRFSAPGKRRRGESEAAALDRLGVLTASERRHLRARR